VDAMCGLHGFYYVATMWSVVYLCLLLLGVSILLTMWFLYGCSYVFITKLVIWVILVYLLWWCVTYLLCSIRFLYGFPYCLFYGCVCLMLLFYC
jgi:hypothetical protein